LALTLVLPLALWGADAELQEPQAPIARLDVQAARVDWLPLMSHHDLMLTVAGPDNLYVQRTFSAGETPFFSASDVNGGVLPDGSYAYELRVVPRLAPETGDLSPIKAEQGAVRSREESLVQSGHLRIQKGAFVAGLPTPPRLGPRPPQPPSSVSAKVVQGRTCIGAGCGAGDDNVPALKLKEDFDNRLTFESSSCCFPSTRSWALQANDTASLSGDFLIRDLTAGTIPFRIGTGGTGVPDNSFTMFFNGNIGLGTATPGAKLHLFGTATADVFASAGPDPASGPAFNIGYGGTSFGRGAGFLNARPDASAIAPNPSLRFLTANVQRMIITNTGNVGIGTTNPGAVLHVASGEVRLPGGTASANGWPTHFRWPADGKNYIRGTTVIADDGGNVGIGTQVPSSKLHVNGGDIRVSGGSFIDDGVTLNVPDYVFDPGYKLMPLEELREFVAREKHLPNVPNARHVKEKGLNLSHFQMRLLEKLEELTLYALTQDERLTTQQEELLRLREQNALLHERLAALETEKR
jgi:hypothetical protein